MNDATYNLLAACIGTSLIVWGMSVLAESCGWIYIGMLMVGTVVFSTAVRNAMNEEK